MKLSEMREGGSRRPTRTIEICLAQDLVAETETLGRELLDLKIATGRGDDDDVPRKLSEGGLPPRAAEIEARLEAIYDEMVEHTGTLRLRAESPGAWQRWKDAHPPRVEDEDGRQTVSPLDLDVAAGYCNATDLFDRLRDFAESWNDEPITDDDWAYLIDNAAAGDLKDACRRVIDMHEAGGSHAPKLRKLSSGMPVSESV
jgi:hypothetical protein